MKKYMIIALAATLFSACQSDNDDELAIDPGNNKPVEIKVNAGISGVQTKAPINSGDNVAGQFVASTTTGDYTNNAWNATGSFAASGTATSFSFSPAQYYPVDGSTIYIKGYYPAGTISGKTVTYTTFDGTQDVMLSNQVSGTKASAATPLAFTFNHLLSQLQFNLVAGPGYDVGKTVTSIVIKAQQTAKTLDINAGTMTTNTGDITLTGPFAISTSGTVAAQRPMVIPGSTSITVSVTTSDGVTYPDATITVTTVVGKAHQLTLTFTPKLITVTAAVTPWDTSGAGGSAPLS